MPKRKLVSELILELQKLSHQDWPIFLSGYEGGVNDVSTLEDIEVTLDFNSQWYYGNHEILDEKEAENAPHTKGYLIK